MPDEINANNQKVGCVGNSTYNIRQIVPNKIVITRLTHHGSQNERTSGF
jgi:hypothetical protein